MGEIVAALALSSDRSHKFLFFCNTSKKVTRSPCMLRAFK
ncbi:hypothetical protein CIT292_06385 [Citrobacter youngae ATCC 29220]|uniref:Uncharacterized protein n=1 Tax=Citrobacter youngae ATCC 29220 TaxID=500640 RepID=D4B7Y1_9ENTR|nr:hypothetical protein CIT292_06385 [Citrobacter youngae ATCC 29220]